MASSAGPDYNDGFTRCFDISSEDSVRYGVIKLLRDFRENDPDCLGKPSGSHTKFAVSYRWGSGSDKLLTKLQASWLIVSLLEEHSQNGTRRVSLWFDKYLCAGSCTGSWVDFGLDAYIFHDVIRLTPPGDPDGFLENVGGRGWMILEHVAGMACGYVRVGGNVAGSRKKFPTLEHRWRHAYQYLSGIICERKFDNVFFSDPSDRTMLRAWATRPTEGPVIGATPTVGTSRANAVRVGLPMKPGHFLSSVLNKVGRTTLPQLYPPGLMKTVGDWTFGAVFDETSKLVSVKLDTTDGKLVVVNRGTVRVAGSNFKVGTLCSSEAKSRYGGSSSEAEVFAAVQAASREGFSSDFLHWVADYTLQGQDCFYIELAKSPNIDESMDLARLGDLFAGGKIHERRGKYLLEERCNPRSVNVQTCVYHMGCSIGDGDLQGVLQMMVTAEGQTAVDVDGGLVIVADTFFDVVKHSLTEDRLLVAAMMAARKVERMAEIPVPGADKPKVVSYKDGLAESGRYPIDTMVVGVLLAAGLAAAVGAAKDETVGGLVGIVSGGVGMLATLVAVYHKCVHDGWPLSPAVRGFMPVTDTSNHRCNETDILRAAWRVGIARRIYSGEDACYVGNGAGGRKGPGALSLEALISLGCATGVSKGGELRLRNPEGILLEIRPVHSNMYHATEVAIESGYAPADVVVDILTSTAPIG